MNKVKFVINGKFLSRRITGTQRYAWEIVNALDNLCQADEFILAAPRDAKNVPQFQNIQVVTVGSHAGIYWEQIEYPFWALKNKRTPLNLCNVAPLIYPGISTIFDMKVKSYPHFFSRKFRMWYYLLFWNQMHRSPLVITDSEDAKNEILNYYPFVNRDKVLVAYCSYQHYNQVAFDENTLSKYELEKEQYYFGMGSLEPNKNFKWIAEVARCNPQLTFAVAGSLNPKVFANGLGFECPSNMKLLGFVSDEEAKTLMRDCKGFLFPSFCEGFGMPPLEAMSAGCANIIVSDIPVMHELFEDCAAYIDNMSYNLPMNARFSTNEERCRILSKFDWSMSASTIYNLLKSLV